MIIVNAINVVRPCVLHGVQRAINLGCGFVDCSQQFFISGSMVPCDYFEPEQGNEASKRYMHKNLKKQARKKIGVEV